MLRCEYHVSGTVMVWRVAICVVVVLQFTGGKTYL